MAVVATFTLDPAALRRITGPGSPVDRDVHRRARRVETRGRQLAPVDTGRLRSSVHVEGPRLGPSSLSYDVVAATGYALFVHDGTRYMVGRPFLLDALAAAR